jgi:hypothetical protein
MLFQNGQKIGIYFVVFSLLLIACATSTKSGNVGFNKIISIKVISGNVSMHISGHVSETIYAYSNTDLEKQNFHNEKTPIISQGRITINQEIIVYETQIFEYTLAIDEALMVNVRSVDDNDAQIIVIEQGNEKEYAIDGRNKIGQIISFKN